MPFLPALDLASAPPAELSSQPSAWHARLAASRALSSPSESIEPRYTLLAIGALFAIVIIAALEVRRGKVMKDLQQLDAIESFARQARLRTRKAQSWNRDGRGRTGRRANVSEVDSDGEVDEDERHDGICYEHESEDGGEMEDEDEKHSKDLEGVETFTAGKKVRNAPMHTGICPSNRMSKLCHQLRGTATNESRYVSVETPEVGCGSEAGNIDYSPHELNHLPPKPSRSIQTSGAAKTSKPKTNYTSETSKTPPSVMLLSSPPNRISSSKPGGPNPEHMEALLLAATQKVEELAASIEAKLGSRESTLPAVNDSLANGTH